ncbi:uncharacterized protein LOC130677811 [Microplitis mediator]|uniref:uncharacterized protein LOC130677811 n=1 Tax=Microplitis mediator TaxID=375433 RepID=UPI00255763E4|nr:uncharacterized protein LOC130677811 [Microplitis mediator]
MYVTDRQYAGYSTWFQSMRSRCRFDQLVRIGVIVEAFTRPISPLVGLELLRQLRRMVRVLPPELEVVEGQFAITWFFVGPRIPVEAINLQDVQVLATCMMETADDMIRSATGLTRDNEGE